MQRNNSQVTPPGLQRSTATVDILRQWQRGLQGVAETQTHRFMIELYTILTKAYVVC